MPHAPRTPLAAALLSLALAAPLHAQSSCPRIMAQDSTLDHLVDPPGTRTVPLGTLGEVVRSGNGTRPMILVPGFGFGARVFEEFTKELGGDYRFLAVTLPGFAGTAPPPSPPRGTSFGAETWTNGALEGIERLMEAEDLRDVVVVGHWIGGTQIALRLAMRRPERVRAVVLLAGAAKMLLTDSAYTVYYGTPERRVRSVDQWLAPRWFATVTRETWDDNNFMPHDYAVHPVRGLRLWREAARPALHVWVRYLNEFNAQDVTAELPKLARPVLLLRPGLDGLWHEPGQDYLANYTGRSWRGAIESHRWITARTIPDSRVCLWFDQPHAVAGAVREFLASAGSGGGDAPRRRR